MALDGYSNPLQRPTLPSRPGHENETQIQLAQDLLRRAEWLTSHAVDAMYEDPFWEERFGERGRRFAFDDGLYHVSYLAHALWFDTASVMSTYADWLRTVLTARGMCSRHLEQNFDRLADAIRAADIPQATPAFTYLEAGKGGVRYGAGPAARLADASREIAERLETRLAGDLPGWRAHPDWTDSPIFYLSYLADAIANDRSDLFASHIVWMSGLKERHGSTAEELRHLLQSLRDEIAALDPPIHDAARPALLAALWALEHGGGDD